MAHLKINHDAVTQAQKLFRELAESGRPNTIYEHSRIAIEALVECGAERQFARSMAAESLISLRKMGVKRNTANIRPLDVGRSVFS